MCESCKNLYTGDRSCMLGVLNPERNQRVENGQCNEASQIIGGVVAFGKMILINEFWEFVPEKVE